jgi:hypothetical protein
MRSETSPVVGGGGNDVENFPPDELIMSFNMSVPMLDRSGKQVG